MIETRTPAREPFRTRAGRFGRTLFERHTWGSNVMCAKNPHSCSSVSELYLTHTHAQGRVKGAREAVLTQSPFRRLGQALLALRRLDGQLSPARIAPCGARRWQERGPNQTAAAALAPRREGRRDWTGRIHASARVLLGRPPLVAIRIARWRGSSGRASHMQQRMRGFLYLSMWSVEAPSNRELASADAALSPYLSARPLTKFVALASISAL